jgi:hypothetical protein
VFVQKLGEVPQLTAEQECLIWYNKELPNKSVFESTSAALPICQCAARNMPADPNFASVTFEGNDNCFLSVRDNGNSSMVSLLNLNVNHVR